MDEVFRAIDSLARRTLLDALFEQDGRTLNELCAVLPEMTRFGVMSQLKVLEEADLVTTRKAGRYKHHYLNPVPIRLVHDRWISRFAEPRVGAIADIKARVEGEGMERPAHIYTSYIRGSAEDVWDAITNPAKTVQYFYGTVVDSTWEPGAPLLYHYPDGRPASDGEIIAVDRPRRLEFSFRALWDDSLTEEGACREVWTLTEVNGMTQLSIELYQIGPRSLDDFANGLPYIVAGLKSLVETGEGLPAPY